MSKRSYFRPLRSIVLVKSPFSMVHFPRLSRFVTIIFNQVTLAQSFLKGDCRDYHTTKVFGGISCVSRPLLLSETSIERSRGVLTRENGFRPEPSRGREESSSLARGRRKICARAQALVEIESPRKVKSEGTRGSHLRTWKYPKRHLAC